MGEERSTETEQQSQELMPSSIATVWDKARNFVEIY